MIRRREFITLLGGAAAAWPPVARAQQPTGMRRIGVFTPGLADQDWLGRNAAFLQGLALLGWIDGRNVRIEYRWGEGDAEHIRKHAVELVRDGPRSRGRWLRR
jgi:putative ABC transport system substrate-binding protein